MYEIHDLCVAVLVVTLMTFTIDWNDIFRGLF